MDRKPWYARYAWLVFVLVGVSGLIPGLQLSIWPLSGETYLNTFGHPIPEQVMATDSGVAFMEFFLRWTGIMVVGVDLLTVLVAATAFRRGRAWAWLAMWYWPAVFLAHYFMYVGGFRSSQLVWLVLTVAALVATYGVVFGRRAGEATRAARAEAG